MTLESPLINKSYAFAGRMAKLSKHLTSHHKQDVLSKQVFSAGTSIETNIRESRLTESVESAIQKLGVALQKTGASLYWLTLLNATGYITSAEFRSMQYDCDELKKMLTTAILNLKNKGE